MRAIMLMINYGDHSIYISRDYERRGYIQTKLASLDWKSGDLSEFHWTRQSEMMVIVEQANYIANFNTIEEAIYRAGQIIGGIIV